MCINLKNIWLWTAVDRASKELDGFYLGTRETKYFENLSEKIAHIKARKYASDYYQAYDLVSPKKG